MILGLGTGIPMPSGVGATMDGPFSPLDLSPVLWLDAADTSTITAADGAWLDGTGLQLPGLSGNYASTPDSAALDITGDIELVARLSIADWAKSTNQVVIAKRQAQRSYDLVFANGKMSFAWSADGTTTLFAVSTVAVTFSANETKWVKVTLDVDNGAGGRTVTFYTADDSASEPSVWTQLGSAVTAAGTTSIYNSTSILEIGTFQTGNAPLNGNIRRAIVRDGIGGTTVFDADFAAEPAGTLSFTEDSTNAATVTLTTTYGQVSQWDDLSGNGYNVTQGTAAYQPKSGTRTLNGRNVLDFLPSSMAVSFGTTYTQPNTIFAVVSNDSIGVYDRIIDGVSSTARHLLGSDATTDWSIYAGNSLTSAIAIDTYSHVVTGLFKTTTSELRVDGTSIATGNAGSIALTGVTIGGSYGNTNPSWNGTIAEIIVCDEAVSADQIAATESYLAAKWGITL